MLRGDVTYFLWYGTRPSNKNIKMWGVRVYINNRCVTRNKLDYKSHSSYFIGYAASTGVIIYWNPDKHFVIHRDHRFWSEEYNSHIYIEYNHTPGSLLLQQYTESLIHNLDILNLIPRELDLTYTPFFDTITIAN